MSDLIRQLASASIAPRSYGFGADIPAPPLEPAPDIEIGPPMDFAAQEPGFGADITSPAAAQFMGQTVKPTSEYDKQRAAAQARHEQEMQGRRDAYAADMANRRTQYANRFRR